MQRNIQIGDAKEDPSYVAAFPPQKILTPVDGSDNATRALRAAITIAKSYGAQLFIITISPRDDLDIAMELPGHTSAVQNYNDEMDKRSERILSDAVDLARSENLTNVTSEAIPEFQSVTKQVLEYSLNNKMDLIVIGTRGLGGFKRLLL